MISYPGEILARFGRYEAVEDLGRAERAHIWKAWDPFLERFVMVAALPGINPAELYKEVPDLNKALSRWLRGWYREGRRVLDFGPSSQLAPAYFVFELVEEAPVAATAEPRKQQEARAPGRVVPAAKQSPAAWMAGLASVAALIVGFLAGSTLRSPSRDDIVTPPRQSDQLAAVSVGAKATSTRVLANTRPPVVSPTGVPTPTATVVPTRTAIRTVTRTVTPVVPPTRVVARPSATAPLQLRATAAPAPPVPMNTSEIQREPEQAPPIAEPAPPAATATVAMSAADEELAIRAAVAAFAATYQVTLRARKGLEGATARFEVLAVNRTGESATVTVERVVEIPGESAQTAEKVYKVRRTDGHWSVVE